MVEFGKVSSSSAPSSPGTNNHGVVNGFTQSSVGWRIKNQQLGVLSPNEIKDKALQFRSPKGKIQGMITKTSAPLM